MNNPKNQLLRFIKRTPLIKLIRWVFSRIIVKGFASIIGSHPDSFKVRPGHFYSTVPDVSLVKSRWGSIFNAPVGDLPGIDENIAAQLELAAQLQPLLKDFPYTLTADGKSVVGLFKGKPLRFSSCDRNKTFHLDAVILQAMLRYFKPTRVVEVGSGYSSTIMLDVREQQGWNDQQLTFIEPFSQDYFFPLLRPEDRNIIKIIEKPLWDVDRDVFQSLESGDLLFIDSSHVAKLGSDVYDYLFNILPILKPGVIIHVHDITANFECASGWFQNGWYWNEGAFLRAFLMFNNQFEILFHSSLLLRMHADADGIAELKMHMEQTFKNKQWHWANSFYIRRK